MCSSVRLLPEVAFLQFEYARDRSSVSGWSLLLHLVDRVENRIGNGDHRSLPVIQAADIPQTAPGIDARRWSGSRDVDC